MRIEQRHYLQYAPAGFLWQLSGFVLWYPRRNGGDGEGGHGTDGDQISELSELFDTSIAKLKDHKTPFYNLDKDGAKMIAGKVRRSSNKPAEAVDAVITDFFEASENIPNCPYSGAPYLNRGGLRTLPQGFKRSAAKQVEMDALGIGDLPQNITLVDAFYKGRAA